MAWRIELSRAADKQLDAIDSQVAKRIVRYLRGRLATSDDPRQLGSALSGALAGYWRYRVGDYRLICDIQDDAVIILVVVIGHRRDVYR